MGLDGQFADLAKRTCMVTVTYGDRFGFLRQVVEAALANGVGNVLVVDNASAPESRRAIQDLERRSEGRVAILSLPENRGSAGGFKAGLEYAVECMDCQYIWLLDDDNLPAQDALAELFKQYKKLNQTTPSDRLALLSLRTDWQNMRKVASGVPPTKVFTKKSRFLGFHVRDLPAKIIKRLGVRRIATGPLGTAVVAIPFGPYGGLFIHKSVLSNIGYPDERFVVYGDDREFTYRLTQSGGTLFLVPRSRIDALEESWHMKQRQGSQFFRLMTERSDFRVYYAVRNSVYVGKYCFEQQPAIYFINKLTFLGILSTFALWYRALGRFGLVMQAIRDGESGRLGRHPDLGEP